MIIKIVKLIDSNQYIYENKPYGAVDVRTSDSETEEEKEASIKSLNSFNYTTDGKNILRLVTIIEAKNLKRAILDSELLFEETIDLLKRQFITKIKNCDDAGYWVNMDTGETKPFLKLKDTTIPFFNQIYQTSLGPYSPMFGEQMIASNRGIEVIETFIRSIHWYNNSNSQARSYLKFLYKWIAIETITKTNVNEDIIPKLCLVLGFPSSKYLMSIPKYKAERLTSKIGYKHYKKIIKDELYECKQIRNAIVHSGFKETNLLDKNLELKLYIINCVFNCMIKTIEKIIISKKGTLMEVWDVMNEYIIQDERLLDWISETFFQQVGNLVSNSSEIPYDEIFQ
jgi:hypothetical protein